MALTLGGNYSTDALKIISMEINPLTGTRVQRALIKGYMGADRQPLTNEHVCRHHHL
jgi:hypothetical protein